MPAVWAWVTISSVCLFCNSVYLSKPTQLTALLMGKLKQDFQSEMRIIKQVALRVASYPTEKRNGNIEGWRWYVYTVALLPSHATMLSIIESRRNANSPTPCWLWHLKHDANRPTQTVMGLTLVVLVDDVASKGCSLLLIRLTLTPLNTSHLFPSFLTAAFLFPLPSSFVLSSP
jgi:hypothetical protein